MTPDLTLQNHASRRKSCFNKLETNSFRRSVHDKLILETHAPGFVELHSMECLGTQDRKSFNSTGREVENVRE